MKTTDTESGTDTWTLFWLKEACDLFKDIARGAWDPKIVIPNTSNGLTSVIRHYQHDASMAHYINTIVLL